MAARTEPPFRADEDEAIRDVVKMQRDVGLSTATDGEFRRATWHMDFIYRLGGVNRAEQNMTVRFHNAQGDIEWTTAALRVDGRIGLPEPIFADDFSFLREVVAAENAAGAALTAKLTIPSPSMVHYRGGRAAIDPAIYPDEEQFWADLSAAYATQVATIAELGCTYLQLDDTS